MLKLLVFILLSYGISNIAVYGSIFEKWRTFWDRVSPNFFGMLFGCMICLPTWVGFILSLIYFNDFSSVELYGGINPYLSTFFDGCLASGSVWALHTFLEYLDRK